MFITPEYWSSNEDELRESDISFAAKELLLWLSAFLFVNEV
jgi:hypothetical protein